MAALPIALAWKTHRPGCHVTCVVQATSSDVLQDQPAVDVMLCDPNLSSLLQSFRQDAHALAFFFTPWLKGISAAVLAGVPLRVLVRSRQKLLKSRSRVAVPSWLNPIAERFSIPQTLRLLGLPPQLPGRPWVMLTPLEKKSALSHLRGVSRSRVLIHPSALAGASGLLRTPWSLILGGLGTEECDRTLLSPWIERGALNLIGELSLREWLAVVVECDVVVSAEEESLFLAEAMGVPTVRVTPAVGDKDMRSVLPEAVVWQVEAVLRHQLRIVERAGIPCAGVG